MKSLIVVQLENELTIPAQDHAMTPFCRHLWNLLLQRKIHNLHQLHINTHERVGQK